MMEFAQWAQEAMGKNSLLNEETLAGLATALGLVHSPFQAFISDIERLIILLGGTVGTSYSGTSGSGAGGGGGHTYPNAVGGPTMPGRNEVVGEKGPEIIRQPYSVSVLPNNVLKAMSYGGVFQNPWENTSMTFPPNFGGDNKQTVNVYLGNERLGSFVLKTVREDLEIG
jgi:hypothetical protein